MNHRALTSRASAVLLFAASLSAPAMSATYYVHATSGSDNTSTNNGSSNKPWKTFAKANSVAISGDTVLLSGGTTWQETLYVKSGVTYNTYGSTSPAIISGGRGVTGLSWSLYKPNVYVATTNASVESGSISQVWAGSTRLTRARTPNVGSGSYGANSRYFKVDQDGNDTTLNVVAGNLPAASGNEVVGATVYARNVGSDLNEYTVANVGLNGSGEPVTLGLSHVSELDPGDFDHPRNRYDIHQESGYWLENKLWMLDKAGEWYFDPVAHRLYIWMPGNIAPNSSVLVSSQANGIVANGATNFKITNVQVQNTASDGLSFNHTSGAILSNLKVLKSGRRGISMAGSSGNTIQASTVDGSAKEGIWLGSIPTGNSVVSPYSMRSVNTTITGSIVANSGLNGYAWAAVLLGEGGSFKTSQVLNSPYLGIFATLGNTVELNLVQNVCTDFDDCGGIYVGQPPVDPVKDAATTDRTQPKTKVLFPNNVVINQNKVDTGKGSNDGVPSSSGDSGTNTRGIYLDDYVNATTVTKNYVTGMRHGIMLHTAFNNTLSNNLLIGNRSHNLLMQEDGVPSLNGALSLPGGMHGNTIQKNGMVASKNASNPTLAIPNIQLIAQNGNAPTGNFASFEMNRYATLNPNAPNIVAYNYGSDVTQVGESQDMTFTKWQQVLSGKDIQGTFTPYQSGREAWGFANPGTASSGLNVECIAASATPCGPFVSILVPIGSGNQLTLPFSMNPGVSVIMLK